jgi:hypothetical protein
VPQTATPITAPRTGLTGMLGTIVQATLDRGAVGATRHVQTLLDRMAPGGGGGALGSPGGGGLGTFDGRPVANWIVPILNWARSHGWSGHITSGYRDPGQVVHSSIVAPQGHSNHNFTAYPGGAIDVGSPEDRADGSALASVLAGAPPIGGRRLVWGGPTIGDWGHFSATGRGRGGFLRRFQSGGRLGAIAGRAVGKAASGIGTKLHIKSLASMQTDRNGRFDAIMGRVDDARADYQRWDARYNLTDEGELIDQTTGEPNVRAINQKLSELSNLAITRKFIEDQLEEARAVARQIVKTYNTIIRSLTRSLRHAKGKDRSGIRSRIKTYQGRLNEWRGKLKDVGGDVFEAHTDVIEIQGELADARAALGGSADIRAQYAQSLADAASQGADTTGGADTAGTADTDAAPAPPTAADIAAAAYQDVQAYLGQQRDLLTSFASNASRRARRSARAACSAAHPDLQGAALGALRGFGGGANLAGSLGLGGSGPSVGSPERELPAAAGQRADAHQQLRFQVENGASARWRPRHPLRVHRPGRHPRGRRQLSAAQQDPDWVGMLDPERTSRACSTARRARSPQSGSRRGGRRSRMPPFWLSAALGHDPGLPEPVAGPHRDRAPPRSKLKRATRALRGDGILRYTPPNDSSPRQLRVRRAGRPADHGPAPEGGQVTLVSSQDPYAALEHRAVGHDHARQRRGRRGRHPEPDHRPDHDERSTRPASSSSSTRATRRRGRGSGSTGRSRTRRSSTTRPGSSIALNYTLNAGEWLTSTPSGPDPAQRHRRPLQRLRLPQQRVVEAAARLERRAAARVRVLVAGAAHRRLQARLRVAREPYARDTLARALRADRRARRHRRHRGAGRRRVRPPEP